MLENHQERLKSLLNTLSRHSFVGGKINTFTMYNSILFYIILIYILCFDSDMIFSMKIHCVLRSLVLNYSHNGGEKNTCQIARCGFLPLISLVFVRIYSF